MRRFFRELAFDISEPGIHMMLIPVFAFIFVVMTYIVQHNLDAMGQSNLITLPLFEILIPSLGGYGSVMLMQGLLDTEGGELYFTYPRSYLYWGLLRQFRFFVLYVLLIAAVCISVAGIMNIDFVQIFHLAAAQSFAVMAVSFLGVTASKKVSIGLILLLAFIGIQITLGQEYGVFNLIYVMSGFAPSYEQLMSISLNSIIVGTFSWVVGQVWVRP
ncbi:MAG: hypothetical protein WDA65_01550 [Christensenellales bacterium]